MANLVVNIIARTAAFASGMEQSRKNLKKFERDIQSVANTAKKWTLVTAGVAAGAVYLAKKSYDGMRATIDMAEQIGVSANQMRQMEYSAKMSGESVDMVSGIFTKYQKILGESTIKGGEAAKMFKYLGLSAIHCLRGYCSGLYESCRCNNQNPQSGRTSGGGFSVVWPGRCSRYAAQRHGQIYERSDCAWYRPYF